MIGVILIARNTENAESTPGVSHSVPVRNDDGTTPRVDRSSELSRRRKETSRSRARAGEKPDEAAEIDARAICRFKTFDPVGGSATVSPACITDGHPRCPQMDVRGSANVADLKILIHGVPRKEPMPGFMALFWV